MDLKLSDPSEIWQAAVLPDPSQMSERYAHSSTQSRCFETFREIVWWSVIQLSVGRPSINDDALLLTIVIPGVTVLGVCFRFQGM